MSILSISFNLVLSINFHFIYELLLLYPQYLKIPVFHCEWARVLYAVRTMQSLPSVCTGSQPFAIWLKLPPKEIL